MTAYRDPRNGRFIARDGLANLVTGAGTTADKRMHAVYALRFVDPIQIEAAYRSSWLMRKVVDLPPYDMTRAWRDWQAKPGEVELIEAEEQRLQLRTKVRRALVLARLHGGSAIVLGAGADMPDQPLEVERIGKGDFRYAHLFSRWELGHGAKRMDPEDPWFGHPEYFQVTGARGLQARIHPSRVVAFIGQAPPEGSRITNHSWFWGDPLMQSIEDAIKNADAAQNGFAALIDEAKVDVFGIPDLLSNLASAEYEARVLRRLALAKLGQSTHNAKIIDANETWETRQITWAGMPDIIDRYMQIVSGAADIPVTRLLGQSPAGMNATGESDLRNYYDSVSAKQTNDLAPLLERIDEVMLRSIFGRRSPDIWFEFAPLWLLTPKEKAEVDKLNAETSEIDARSGLVDVEALAAGRRGRIIEDAVYPGIEAAFDAAGEALTVPALEEPDEPDPNELQATEPPAPAARQVAKDAAPRSLYVSRKVVNAAEIIAWAKAQGFETTQPADQLHVTIINSRTPLDWMKVSEGWGNNEKGELTIAPGGPRIVEPLGDKGAVVLLFNSWELTHRHGTIRNAGAAWKFDEYQPHITITYQLGDLDLSKVEPYRGRIVLGPEVFEEVVDDWEKTVVES